MVNLLSHNTKVLDRYRVIEKVAAGGLSVVYQGEDQRLPRQVCIKVFHALPSSSSDQAFQASYDHFVQEAFALSLLDHPNTLRIYDFGYFEDPDRPSLQLPVQISEFMNGGTLQKVVSQHGGLLATDVLKIASCIGGALAEAHANDIVHRDLKPKNILFSSVAKRQIVKLADFGIAKSLLACEGPEVGKNRLLMYSLNWAAPEQLSGEKVNETTDVYSLGLVVLYMITGRMLFWATKRAEALAQRMSSDRSIEVLALKHRISASVVDLLQRTCSPEIADRPKDVESFVEELHEVYGETTARDRFQPALVAIDAEATTSVDAEAAVRPQRIHVGVDEQIGDRRATFIEARDAVEFVIADRARIRAALVPIADGRFCLHVKGLNCFIRLMDRPPSSAVQVKEAGEIKLQTPRGVIATANVEFGEPAAGHNVFHIDHQPVAVSTKECRWVIGVDFGPSEAYRFIYASESDSVVRMR